MSTLLETNEQQFERLIILMYDQSVQKKCVHLRQPWHDANYSSTQPFLEKWMLAGILAYTHFKIMFCKWGLRLHVLCAIHSKKKKKDHK